ncbi:hypothetical protein Tco_0037709 [Tanacetum coccineum]
MEVFPRLYMLETNKECKVSDRWCLENVEWRGDWAWWSNPRGREAVDLVTMIRLVDNLVLFPDSRDRRFWVLRPPRKFLIKDLFCLVESKSIGLGQTNQDFIWNPWVPRKVNIFIWRASMDRLPSRANLFNRDAPVPTVSGVDGYRTLVKLKVPFVFCSGASIFEAEGLVSTGGSKPVGNTEGSGDLPRNVHVVSSVSLDIRAWSPVRDVGDTIGNDIGVSDFLKNFHAVRDVIRSTKSDDLIRNHRSEIVIGETSKQNVLLKRQCICPLDLGSVREVGLQVPSNTVGFSECGGSPVGDVGDYSTTMTTSVNNVGILCIFLG